MNTIKNLKTLFIIVIALLGCDTVIELENQSPQVEVTSLCISDGRVYIDLMVTDVDEDPVDVALRVADPGAIEGLSTNVDSTGLVAAGPEADGLLGLSSDSVGRHHRIEWAQCPETIEGCGLPNEVVAQGGTNGCVCLTSVDMFHVLQSLEVRATDRKSDVKSATFADIEVLDACPTP